MKGWGWFKLLDRARGGDLVDMVIDRVARHGECNIKMKSLRRRRRREEGEGGEAMRD